MIAKIVKGSNFRGVVNYILDKEKDAKILVCDGLFAENKETIANSFEAQAKMNPRSRSLSGTSRWHSPRRTNTALPTGQWQESHWNTWRRWV